MITRVTVSKRRNEYGEFVVRAYGINGARLPEADYHTDCRVDAAQTAKAMLADFENQFVVTVGAGCDDMPFGC